MTISLAVISGQKRDAREPRRWQRFGPRIAASAIVHLVLVLLVVQFAPRRPPAPAPQAPSFQLMLEPGRPAKQNLPPSLPAPSAPPQARPAPPPQAAMPRRAPPPTLPSAAVPSAAVRAQPAWPILPPPAPARPPAALSRPAPAPTVAPPRPLAPPVMPQPLLPQSLAAPGPSAVVPEAAPPPVAAPVVVPPPVSVPPVVAAPAASRALTAPLPAPSALPFTRSMLLPPTIPAPKPPGPAQAPPVRLALADPAPENLVPLPDPVPIPEPEPLPEAAPAPPRPAAPRPRPAAAPSHMTITLADPLPDAPGTAAQEPADDMIHVRGTDVPEAWKVQLHRWWEEHGYYPEEASRRAQQGTVSIHVRIDHDGHVRLVGLNASSGSQWLDAGAQAVFRGETVPALPPESTEPEKDLDLTIHYMLYRPR